MSSSALRLGCAWLTLFVIGTDLFVVAPLLHDVLSHSGNARVHLVGHSFGAKVCLAALCAGQQPRAVEREL